VTAAPAPAPVLPSIIRTVVPYVVGLLLAYAARVGLNIPGDALTLVVAAVLSGGYYGAARLIERRWPSAGRVLLALGLTAQQPSYAAPVAIDVRPATAAVEAAEMPGTVPATVVDSPARPVTRARRPWPPKDAPPT